MSSIIQRSRSLTLSFSGAGHLLPYHLGVAIALKEKERHITQKIHAVSGSSSGALAASAFVHFTDEQIKDYAESFINDRGRAMFHFKQMFGQCNNVTPTQQNLHIATTRCSDGSLHLFDFLAGSSSDQSRSRLTECLEASCKIPHHFHPADVLPSKWPSKYPEENGIIIDGNSFCDGGIAAPAPPTPIDNEEGVCRIVVSPISGGNNEKNAIRISPRDDSWKFPMDIKCRGGFAVHPSLQNIKAMQVSAGVASTPILRKWYERGMKDVERILEL
mmetsp:Transcript_25907/g.40652  ORF Transcript_25907/g.40652 Transcript_25907/m.40652 type:complete len:274 (-) Transcript_25907:73-894(-)